MPRPTRILLCASAPLQMLKGMRVVELASVLAGPSVGQYLAELGAEVIKVENSRTRGDVTRTWRLRGEAAEDGRSAYFHAANVGKKSIGIDAGTAAGVDLLHRMVACADVVIASYKPGDAEKLRLDYNTLKAFNPRLVYAKITGYGEDNPRAGYDAVVQAESGFQYMNGQPESSPTKMPVALMDLLAAHQLKQAILLALWHRERTGEGQEVQTSLIRAGVSSLANQASAYLKTGTVAQRMGSDHPSICPYGTLFVTADDKLLTLAVGSDKQYAGLCGVLGLEVLEEHRTNPLRVANREACKAYLAPAILKWQRADLLGALEAKAVPAGAVNAMDDVFRIPEVQSLVIREDGDGGGFMGVRQVASGYSDAAPAPPLAPPPRYAQHTREVLSAMGLPDTEVDSLIAEGVVTAAGA